MKNFMHISIFNMQLI